MSDEEKVKIEVNEFDQEAIEEKKIGSVRRPNSGVKLFEYNLETGEVGEVQLTGDVSYDPTKKEAISNRKAHIKKGYVYDWAINKKNAKRKMESKYKFLIELKKYERSKADYKTISE